MMFPIALLDGFSPATMIFLGIIAVLLFGEHLPEVARSWGKKFTEFRKSIQSVQDEIRSAAFSATSELTSALDIKTPTLFSPSSSSSNGSKARRARQSEEDYEEATAPKFVPPPAEPEA
jgi:sec-independent protein translocase protein TatA